MPSRPAAETGSHCRAGSVAAGRGRGLVRSGRRARASRCPVRSGAFFRRGARNGYQDEYAAGYNEMLMLIEAGDTESAIRVRDERPARLKAAELYKLVSARLHESQPAQGGLRRVCVKPPGWTRPRPNTTSISRCCVSRQELRSRAGNRRGRAETSSRSAMVSAARRRAGDEGGDRTGGGGVLTRERASPRRPSTYVALAMVWMQRGQSPGPSRCCAAHATAAKATGRSRRSSTRSDRALAFGRRTGRYGGQRGVEAFRAAVRLDSELVPAQAELGKLLVKRGDLAGGDSAPREGHCARAGERRACLRARPGLPAHWTNRSSQGAAGTGQPVERAGARRRSRYRSQANDVSHRARGDRRAVVIHSERRLDFRPGDVPFSARNTFGNCQRRGGVCCRRGSRRSHRPVAAGRRRDPHVRGGPLSAGRHALEPLSTGGRPPAEIGPGGGSGSAVTAAMRTSRTCLNSIWCSASCSPSNNSSDRPSITSSAL